MRPTRELPVQGKVKSYAAPVKIGELAQPTGTTTKTLRFYEQAGLLPEPDRTPAGCRDYDESVVDRLGFVKAAQTAGLRLAEIRDVIAAREHGGPPCSHVAALLDAHAVELASASARQRAARGGAASACACPHARPGDVQGRRRLPRHPDELGLPADR